MVAFILLTMITAAAMPLAIGASSDKYIDGTEWWYLDHFLTWMKETHPNNTAVASRLRAKGTFWGRVTAGGEDPLKYVEPYDKSSTRCVVMFYYPTMPQRGRDSVAKKDRDTTWGVPFAVTPVCGDDVIPTESPEFPYHDTEAEGDQDRAVVFSKLFGGDKLMTDDVYVTLT
jgi:hypothetical protein